METKFQDVFTSIINSTTGNDRILYADWFETPLGPIIAVTDDQKLHLLEFEGRKGLAKAIKKLNATLVHKSTPPIKMIKEELKLYFAGKLKEFKTPINMEGSKFQQKVWHELIQIPFGKTLSYLNQAEKIGNEKAFRAVANANGMNNLAIIVPCHRVINKNGKLGGYGGGIERKEWLLQHEKKHA